MLVEEEIVNKNATRGTNQLNRGNIALEDKYVNIDERSLNDLLTFIYATSKYITFYDLENKPDGAWQKMLKDELFIIALILENNPVSLDKKFSEYILNIKRFNKADTKKKYLTSCFDIIYQSIIKLDEYYVFLEQVNKFKSIDNSIQGDLRSIITTKLSRAFLYFKHILNEVDLNGKYDLELHEIWNSHTYIADEYSTPNSKDSNELFAWASYRLELVFQDFYETFLYLKNNAKGYLEKGLNDGDHEGHIALLVSFLQLYKLAQGNLNNLKSKHLDYYYQNILKQTKKSFTEDDVVLKFSKFDTNNYELQIPKGTLFTAGKDQYGADIPYELTDEAIVNSSKVKTLHNLHIHAEDIEGFKMIKKINYDSLKINEYAPGVNEESVQFLFGTEYDQHKEIVSKVGFAIASPGFYLNEGYREIGVKIQFSEEDYQILLDRLSAIASYNSEGLEEFFLKAFQDSFLLSYTSIEGWVDLQNVVVSKSDKSQYIQLGFVLSEKDLGFIHHQQKIHGNEIDTDKPVLRVHFNNNSFLYPASILENLKVEQVIIDTSVKGVKNIQVQNDLGAVSIDNPYMPFGPVPHQGSYVLIGSQEVFQKNLDELKIHLNWFNTPTDNEGFKKYYDGYGLKVTNNDFKFRISALSRGKWIPEENENQQEFSLFTTINNLNEIIDEPVGRVSKTTDLVSIDITKLKQPANYKDLTLPLKYGASTNRGFVKLELVNPQSAFHHSIYPSVLSEAILKKNSKTLLKTASSKNNIIIPQEAYTPTLSSITIDYKSTTVINADDRTIAAEKSGVGQIKHLNPFGNLLVFPDSSRIKTTLVDSLSHQGELLIGINTLRPNQTLSFLFELKEEFTRSSEDSLPEVEWQYLSKNKWFSISSKNILKETTNNFIKTGIVELLIPEGPSLNNTVLDPDLYWLRVVVKNNIEIASKFKGITTQVASAKLKANQKQITEEEWLEQPLPSFYIARPIKNIKGLQQVVQPLASYNGVPEETNEAFKYRIAERLRHKNRAITSWDYERLVLDAFPEIGQVACLPNMNSSQLKKPGSVLITVVPKTKNEIGVLPLANNEVLSNIKKYLSQRISPFVNLEVRNPAYEKIRISCKVKFSEGVHIGYYLQQLNDEIVQYISNNVENQVSNYKFGGKITVSDVVTFLRTLSYIENIADFSIIQVAKDFSGKWQLLDTAREEETKEFLQATKPWSVLVSFDRHHINVTNSNAQGISLQSGIEDLELGSDFIIER